MASKRDLLASYSGRTGVTRLLELLPTRPMLLVLNYHRIGDAAASPFDSGVFSCTGDELDEQVRALKRRGPIASLDEAIEIVEGRRRPRGTTVLLTFDDGYLDNWTTAFPILTAHGVPAVFFLPTSFVGTSRLPWWDSIAWIVKHSAKPVVRLQGPGACEFDLGRDGPLAAVERVLWAFKHQSAEGPEEFIGRLEEACGVERPRDTARLFIDWDEAAAMQRAGMTIGAHTHSHEILSTLTPAQQRDELLTSKRILEERLDAPVRSMSYPVGLPHTFNAATRDAADEAGYRLAFSFYGGFNPYGGTDRYDVRRFAVSVAPPRLRFQTALAAVTGKYWF